MARSRTRTIVAAGAAAAVAAGFVVTLGASPAGATPGSVTWSDGNSKFTRTVSNTTPNEGDIVTVSTKFERTGGVVEWLQAVKDLHPPCLTYVGGARATPEIAADYARVTGSWPVYPNIDPKSQTFDFQYRVGADCVRGVPLTTTMHYSGTLGSGTYVDKGPTVTVTKNTTTTTLAAVAGPVTAGQSVTLTATVTGGSQGDPVDFYDGTTKLGSGTLNASGVATFTWTSTTQGSHSLQARYLGTAKANPSDSAPQSVSVVVPTSMTVSAPSTALTGTAATLSATVTPSNAVGTVQFKDSGANIGSPQSVSNGTATLQHTFATAGSHSITAEFSGAGFVSSSAPAQTITVSVPDLATTTTLTVPQTARTGTEVTLSADVAPNPGSGTVQFKDNGAEIGAPVAISNGTAQLPHTFSSAGQHSITAVFSGAPGFTASSAAAQPVTVSVPDQATTTTLTVPPTAETNQQVTLTANLDPTNASGTVQFKDNGTNIGSAVAVANGVAALQYSFATAGNHSVTAAFAGNAGFSNSSAAAQSVTVTTPVVPDAPTTTTLTVPATTVKGTATTLTATVTPANASGSVQFLDGQTPIGGPATVTNGTASVQHSFATSGNHSIGAVFTAGAGFLGSTATAKSIMVTDPVVVDVTTTTTLTVPPTAETGQQITLTANLDPSNAAGSVQFKDGATNMGGPVAVVNGTATAQTSFTTAGSHSITAVFTGSTGFKSSTSSAQTVTVSAPVVQTSLTLSAPSDAQTGSAITFTAAVTPANAAGTVQFTVDGNNIGGGVTVSNGIATLPYTFSAAGVHSVGASFAGAAGFTSSSATSRPVQVSVPTPADIVTTTAVTVPSTATVGQPVTLSAEVSGGTNLPGTVQFFDGDVPISGNVDLVEGVATAQHTFATDGAHAITARYSGGQGAKASASPVQSVQVSPVDNGGDGGGTGSLGSLGNLSGSLSGVGRSGFGS
ncbi:beta strand repeat-containing protein [Prescottella equi]|uniref:beta strand repeat-containing protein n=1 Tax=Rhodococcus hoagii TaxID=43767 RepID=UPI00111C2E55|nr:Ig-like domain-containing protein [Prescottella equi]